jgi:putative oxidoreductase
MGSKKGGNMVSVPNSGQVMILTGRILLAFIFLASGLSKIPGWDATANFMASKGFPWVPVFLFPAIFIEVIGGLCLCFGFRARVAAAVLLIYMIPVTLLFHNFWVEQGMERQTQLINFMKNLAIMGGLFGVVANGAGVMSIDYRLSRRNQGPSQSARDRIRAVS